MQHMLIDCWCSYLPLAMAFLAERTLCSLHGTLSFYSEQ